MEPMRGDFRREPAVSPGKMQAEAQILTENTGEQGIITCTAFYLQGRKGWIREQGLSPLQQISAVRHFETSSTLLPFFRAALLSLHSRQHAELAHSHSLPRPETPLEQIQNEVYSHQGTP